MKQEDKEHIKEHIDKSSTVPILTYFIMLHVQLRLHKIVLV